LVGNDEITFLEQAELTRCTAAGDASGVVAGWSDRAVGLVAIGSSGDRLVAKNVPPNVSTN
jgi:hypothetical protein